MNLHLRHQEATKHVSLFPCAAIGISGFGMLNPSVAEILLEQNGRTNRLKAQTWLLEDPSRAQLCHIRIYQQASCRRRALLHTNGAAETVSRGNSHPQIVLIMRELGGLVDAFSFLALTLVANAQVHLFRLSNAMRALGGLVHSIAAANMQT